MKHRQRWAWLAVIPAATLALLAAGLIQTVSGAGATSPGGTLTGTVVISGAPSGFAPPYLGVGACPAGGPPGLACPNPVYSLASGATYTLPLTAGTWTVDGFYEINAYGGAFLSPPQTVTIPSGGTVHLNFTVLYQSPATVKGTINVTGVPSGVTVYSLSALLCPSFAPYNGVTPSIVCVNGYGQLSTGGASTTYLITGLPSGKWTAYPSYCTEFGCATNANAGKAFNLVAGGKKKVNLTTPFLTPAEGLLTATVTVTGAPVGFAAPVAFSACQVGTGICQSSYGYPFGGNSFPLLLATGQWTVNGRYLVPPFDNAISGPSQTVTITGGQVTSVALAVPYQVLGTAAGTIHVTGNQSRVPITAYTMIACPASAVGRTSPECVSEFSGPGGFGYAFAATKQAQRHLTGAGHHCGWSEDPLQPVPAVHAHARLVDLVPRVSNGVRLLHRSGGNHGDHHCRADVHQEVDSSVPDTLGRGRLRQGRGHRCAGQRVPVRGPRLQRPTHRDIVSQRAIRLQLPVGRPLPAVAGRPAPGGYRGSWMSSAVSASTRPRHRQRR